MAKIRRNDPCRCGSGKKYKRCCLTKVEAGERHAFAAAAVAPLRDLLGFVDDCDEELAAASNVVVDLVDAGNLDEAEQAAHQLLHRFPNVHDGYARLGLVAEARGDNRQAVEYYRKVIAFAHEHPERYDPVFDKGYQVLIDRLKPTAAD